MEKDSILLRTKKKNWSGGGHQSARVVGWPSSGGENWWNRKVGGPLNLGRKPKGGEKTQGLTPTSTKHIGKRKGGRETRVRSL